MARRAKLLGASKIARTSLRDLRVLRVEASREHVSHLLRRDFTLGHCARQARLRLALEQRKVTLFNPALAPRDAPVAGVAGDEASAEVAEVMRPLGAGEIEMASGF